MNNKIIKPININTKTIFMKKLLFIFTIVIFANCNSSKLMAQIKMPTTKSEVKLDNIKTTDIAKLQSSFNDNEDIQNKVKEQLITNESLQGKALDFLKNNPETKNKVMDLIKANPEAKNKVMEAVLKNPDLTSKVMNWVSSNPEILKQAMSLIGM